MIHSRKLQTLYLIFLFVFLGQCRIGNKNVDITDKIDPDIVLINIGDGNRTAIAELLLKIDSCKPKLIAIDAWFIEEKDSIQDVSLIKALKAIQNDILSYITDINSVVIKSHLKFDSLSTDRGLAVCETEDGLLSHIIPIKTIHKEQHELFALKIIKHWKPQFESKFNVDDRIPIRYTRTLDQFTHLEGTEVLNGNYSNILTNKIVLVGYLGPTNEDKHYTPIRLAREYPENEPDTYGVVIIANSIRTILEYEK